MGPLNVNRGPCNLNMGPCYVIMGLRKVNKDRGTLLWDRAM